MRRAFTMLELVFVIVIVGILSIAIIPNFQRNTLQEAADQLISHIRYTQHLAMMDNKFDPNDNDWYKERWQIIFGASENATAPDTHGKVAYTIFSDKSATSAGQPDLSEMAINPLDSNKYLSGGYSGILDTSNSRATKEMNIGEEYGVVSYNLTGGCSGARLSFDYLGRPIKGNLASMIGSYTASTQRLIDVTCKITIADDTNNIVIAIEPETGYAHILQSI